MASKTLCFLIRVTRKVNECTNLCITKKYSLQIVASFRHIKISQSKTYQKMWRRCMSSWHRETISAEYKNKPKKTDFAICWQRSGGHGTSSDSFWWSPVPGSPSPDVSLKLPEEEQTSLVKHGPGRSVVCDLENRSLTSSSLACRLALLPPLGSWLRAASICMAHRNQSIILSSQRRGQPSVAAGRALRAPLITAVTCDAFGVPLNVPLPAVSPAWARPTVSQPRPASGACPAEGQGNQDRLPAPPSPAGSFPPLASQRWAAAAGPLKAKKHVLKGNVAAPGQHPDVFTVFSVSWYKLESLPGTAAVEGMTPLLFIHPVGTATVCLYGLRERLEPHWISVWVSHAFLTPWAGIPLSASCSRTRWRSSRWGSAWGWTWQTEAWAEFLFLLDRAKSHKRH